MAGPGDEGFQPADGVFPVFFLTAEPLGLDDNEAILCDPVVAEHQESLFVGIRQGRGLNVKAQMNSGGHLVDILSPCSLGSDGMDFYLGQGDGDGIGYVQHQLTHRIRSAGLSLEPPLPLFF